jgi:hypothetical protein
MALNALAEVELLAGQPAEALAWVAQADELAAGDAQTQAQPPAARRTRLFEGVALHLQGQHARASATMAHFCSAADRAAAKVLARRARRPGRRFAVDAARAALAGRAARHRQAVGTPVTGRAAFQLIRTHSARSKGTAGSSVSDR